MNVAINITVTGVIPFLNGHKKLVMVVFALVGYILVEFLARVAVLPILEMILPALEHLTFAPVKGITDSIWLLSLLALCGRLMLWPPKSNVEAAFVMS